MKRLLIILSVLVLSSANLLAQTGKEKRYASNYDVLKYLPKQSDHDPATFWKSITQNNTEFQKNAKKFENPKGLAKKAESEVMNAAYRNSILRNMTRRTEEDIELCNIIRYLMLGDEQSEMEFEVIDHWEPNAYCTPDGYVCIYTGIIERLEGNVDLMSGVIAHEIAHYMYKHALILRHKTLKKERENQIGAAIHHAGVGFLDVPNKDQMIQNIYDNAELQTNQYRYKYSRKEEVEADVVAYRFLDWMGIDPENMSIALRRIAPFGPLDEEHDDDDHPSFVFRLGVLSALKPAFYNNTQGSQP